MFSAVTKAFSNEEIASSALVFATGCLVGTCVGYSAARIYQDEELHASTERALLALKAFSALCSKIELCVNGLTQGPLTGESNV